MSAPRFLQIHTLTSYPATLLNRDDAGFAKRLPFGGKTRTRVSSQCLKYHWRHNDGEHSLYSLDVQKTFRSRQTFIRKIAEPLIEEGYPAPLVRSAVLALKELLLSDKAPGKKDLQSILNPDAESTDDPLATSQVTILGEPEIAALKKAAIALIEPLKESLPEHWNAPETPFSDDHLKLMQEALKELKKKELKANLKGLHQASGLDAAIFGRMTTSDILARGDAAIHVAHSFTTHEQASESDYFSAVDELTAAEGTLGGGHINSSELTSGLFYSYVVVDIPLLISNIEGFPREEWTEADRDIAAAVIEHFIKLMATTSPGAKLGSTAPYAWADMVLVEAGLSQPRTLANAFRKPVAQQPDVLENSYIALGRYVKDLDQMYGPSTERQLAARGPVDGLLDSLGLNQPVTLNEAASWAASKVRG